MASSTTTTDSTTTLSTRPVVLTIQPDTFKSTVDYLQLTHQFSQAQVGAVLALRTYTGSKKGKTLTIRKVDNNNIEFIGISEKKDTTVTVQDTKTVVHTKTLQVVKEEPTALKKWLLKARDNVIYSVFSVLLLLLLILLIIRKLTA